MKATGMIRKIDDLGRIVIPKEIRKTLRIREADPLEIYVEGNGEIVLKRYAPFGDILDQIEACAKVLAKNTGFLVYVTDSKHVIATSNNELNKYIGADITDELVEKIEQRILWQNTGENYINILAKQDLKGYTNQIISPIISEGDALGAVILFTENNRKKVTDIELKMLHLITDYLCLQME